MLLLVKANKPTDRKLRLFTCACCLRHERDLHRDDRVRTLIDTAERFADQLVDVTAMNDACRTARQYMEEHVSNHEFVQAGNLRDFVIAMERTKSGRAIAIRVAGVKTAAMVLGDLFGNPFRPVTADACWLTPTVVSLATAIYDERAFDGLPILADALEDAGCTNADILDHCRQPGEHVRGCWAVDLALGKT